MFINPVVLLAFII